MAERPLWQEFGQSRFTHIGRNDSAVNEILRLREVQGLPPVKSVLLLGSGLVEPFTLAANPRLVRASVVAVEPDEEVLELAQAIKQGKALSWQQIGDVSCNTQLGGDGKLVKRENTDFTDVSRIRNGFDVLENIGSLFYLAAGFNQEYMKVPGRVCDRVTFVGQDALSFLREGRFPPPDLGGDFFLRANINKHPKGGKYTREMTDRSFELMGDTTILMIGDTGRNLPLTLEDLSSLDSKGKLNMASMVHAVNIGSGFITSHYLIASKMTHFPPSVGIDNSVRERLYDEASPFAAFFPGESKLTVQELSRTAKTRINLAYLAVRGYPKKGTAWNSRVPINQALAGVVPNQGDEFSEDLAFPAQKPHLRTYFVSWGK